jgi:hypothetical protein
MVRKALCIVLAANRPLTVAEMNIAVNISISSTSIEDLDLEAEDDFRARLRSRCGLFISIYHGKVYFLHQTAGEFLLPALSSPTTIPAHVHWHRSIDMRQAHSVLAEICVVYLTFLNSEDLGFPNTDSKTESEADNETDLSINEDIFLDYSARHWATHFRETQMSSSEALILSVLKICEADSKSLSTWFDIYLAREANLSYTGPFSTIMTASYFGHERR